MSTKSPLRTLAVSLLFALPLAQASGASIHIHDAPVPQPVTTSSGSTGLSLQASFSLLDSEQQVLRSFEISDASFELEGESYAAQISELETPWSLVVLMDSSSTLGTFATSATFKAAKAALAEALGGTPEGTTLALMAFNDETPTIEEFTADKDRLSNSLRSIPADTFGNSCLNEGIYQAANKLGGAPGRRGVIVLTASADNCATRLVDEVIGIANQNRVQVYLIGLEGYTINPSAMQALAGPTGGVVEFRDEGTLGFGLSNIMAVLSNQWTARATVYPSAGQQSANLTINLQDEVSLTSSPIEFVSSQDYIPPAEARLRGTVQSVGDGILFNLDLVQPEQIRQLNVSIISKDTGQSVLAQSLLSFSEVNTVPAVSLSPGLEYTLVVTAINNSGQPISEDQADFEYEPPQASLSITEVQSPTAEQPEFVLTVASQNLRGVVKYTAWLADVESGVPISGTEHTVPVGEPLAISAEGLSSGEYAVVVQALDSGDVVLAESAPQRTSYERPSAFESLRRFVADSPLAIAGITGLLCLTAVGIAALLWFVLPRRGTKAATVELVLPQKARGVERATPPQGVPQPPAAAEEVPMPSAQLVARKPAELEFSAKVTHSPFHVGRQPFNDAVLPVDSASGVSGKHLSIRFENGLFFVQDENSTYGTRLGGKQLDKGGSAPLRDGDVLGLGPELEVEFRIGSAESTESQTS